MVGRDYLKNLECSSDYSIFSSFTGEILRDPVLYGGALAERSAAEIRQPGGSMYTPSADLVEEQDPPRDVASLIKQTGSKVSELVVMSGHITPVPLMAYKLTLPNLQAGIKMANVELPMHAPLSLRTIITPAMTLDEGGFNAVYISRGGVCAGPNDAGFLRPCHGGEVDVDVNAVSSTLFVRN